MVKTAFKRTEHKKNLFIIFCFEVRDQYGTHGQAQEVMLNYPLRYRVRINS